MQALGKTAGVQQIKLIVDKENINVCNMILFKVTGLGTALKILFSGEFDKPHLPGLPKAKEDLKLSRNEIVALFNSFKKLSTSIVELEKFRELLRKNG